MKRTYGASGKSTKLAKKVKSASTKKIKSYIPTKVYIGKQPLPLQLFNTVKYAESVVMTPSGGLVIYQFSCNSLYDPNRTGTGHQPGYFDQLIAIYDHYTVLKSRFKITPGVSSSITAAQMACVYVDDDTSTVTSLAQALEQRNATKCYTWIPGAMNPPQIRYNWDAAKTFGPNPQAQDSLQGTASSNPTEESFYTFVFQDAAAGSTGFTALVEIEFDTVWDELKTINQS